MAEHYQSNDRTTLLACLPFSKPGKISGAWVRGFEMSGFFEGQRASASLASATESAPELQSQDQLPVDGKLWVFQVTFIGRRSTCALGTKPTIVVDRVLSSELKYIVSWHPFSTHCGHYAVRRMRLLHCWFESHSRAAFTA